MCKLAPKFENLFFNLPPVGNYLQRLELFEKSIQSYNEALKWHGSDVHSLLGRSTARAKATYYTGALEDAAKAAELAPENLTALQIRAHTEYEKGAFEKSLVLAHRGARLRRLPPGFFECARIAEQTIRECIGDTSKKILASVPTHLGGIELISNKEEDTRPKRKPRMPPPQPTHQVEDMSRAEKQRSEQISRLMASKYLERMAHDKYFLTALCKDERLASANKQGSKKLQELAHSALADIEKRQEVLRERRPLYAARAIEASARARLSKSRHATIKHSQTQHITDSKRLIKNAIAAYEKRDTAQCLETVEFGIEQISKKPANLLPGKEKFLQQLYDIVSETFLDQKRVRDSMSESDREKRAFILLGMALSREPSRDSVLRVRPPAPPRDAKLRLRTLERALASSSRASEQCYLQHELARLHVDLKQSLKARYYALKCQAESRKLNHRGWQLNACFLLARCHLLQNNRPEARVVLLEGLNLARSSGFLDIASFFDTCVNVSGEGDVLAAEAPLEQREKAMVSLMQDDDLRSEAKHLFRRMSVLPAARRFSIMPGTRVEDTAPVTNRRISIIPRTQQPVRVAFKNKRPLGFQDFDI